MLRTYLNALLGGSQGAKEIEHPRTMRKIVEKLPHSMQDRWRVKENHVFEKRK